jgi:hypothetical protein
MSKLAAAVRTLQAGLPVASSSAQTTSSLPRLLIPKIRPPATEGAELPVPNPGVFQSSGGPPAGHCFSSPVSRDTPVRSGPRNCGHSTST